MKTKSVRIGIGALLYLMARPYVIPRRRELVRANRRAGPSAPAVAGL